MECGRSFAYVGGWVTALAAVAVATVLVYPDVSRTATTSRGHAAVELAAGLVLGGWLLTRWRRPKDPGTDSQPSWMGRLDAMSPLLAFGLGAFLPTLCRGRCGGLRDAVQRAHPGMVGGRRCRVGMLGSAGVASPLMVLVTDRDHAPETYQRWRSWIVGHSRAVLYGVGALVCLVLVGKGIAGLVG